ncbi:MAG: hypothetical protein AB8U25_07160 [Rickettsiales endosymbiont of Dermacentor nuttalli]
MIEGNKVRDQRVDIKNGSFGVIKEISNSRYKTEILVELDDKRLVSFNPRKFNKFDYDYGITINKAEGVTVDRIFAV